MKGSAYLCAWRGAVMFSGDDLGPSVQGSSRRKAFEVKVLSLLSAITGVAIEAVGVGFRSHSVSFVPETLAGEMIKRVDFGMCRVS
jgi:hypothetical protein